MAGGRQAGAFSAAAFVALLTLLAFVPLLGFPFLNWDDQDVFVRNDALRANGAIAWAFTTRFMEHYQPLSWLTWVGVDRTLGLTSSTAHGLNVVLHALCAAVVWMLVWRVGTAWKAVPYRSAESATTSAFG